MGRIKKLPRELATDLLYLELPGLNYLPISASCGVKRYMYYYDFFLLKLHKQSLNQFFLLDLFLFILLIIYQSANDKWMSIWFSKHDRNNILIDVLLKYSHSNQSKPIIFSCVRRSIHLYKIQVFGDISLHCNDIVIGKKFRHFLFVWFYYCHGRLNYILHSLFIISRPSS